MSLLSERDSRREEKNMQQYAHFMSIHLHPYDQEYTSDCTANFRTFLSQKNLQIKVFKKASLTAIMLSRYEAADVTLIPTTFIL